MLKYNPAITNNVRNAKIEAIQHLHQSLLKSFNDCKMNLKEKDKIKSILHTIVQNHLGDLIL